MKKLKKLLFIILCLPILPIIGTPGEGGGDTGGSAAGGAKSGDTGAQGVADTNSGAGAQSGTGDKTGSTQGDASQQAANQTPGKTFTQDEVNRMMTAEKEQGRRAVLAELGITDPAQSKTLLELAAKLGEATKPTDQKLDEAGLKLATATRRAEAAEQKLTLVEEKAKTEYLNDVFALANARVTDKVDFKAAVAEVKKAHPTMFEDGEAGTSGGTGNPPDPKRQSGGADKGYGKRAAAINKAAPAKSSFFKNS